MKTFFAFLNFLQFLRAAARAYREAGVNGYFMMKIYGQYGCECVVEVCRLREAILCDEEHRELQNAIAEYERR